MTAPMTAAEYREVAPGIKELTPFGKRTLAALEEREALLGERAAHLQRGYWQCSDCGEKWRYTNPTEEAEVGAEAKKHGVTCDKNPLKSDASVGALVRRIREHPMNRSLPYPIRPFGGESVFSIDAAGLTAFLRYLDSLLPKEPEVVTGPSGNRYKMEGTGLHATFVNDGYYVCPASRIPVEDAPVVAKLMGGNDGE